jgi:fumarylacetoacetase
MITIDETHDPALESFIESANAPDTDFPVQNLPLGTARRPEGKSFCAVAIGDRVLKLRGAEESGLFDDLDSELRAAVREPNLNGLMALGRGPARELRLALSRLLRRGSSLESDAATIDHVLIPMDDVEMLVPATIGDYTDFYASVHHATNVGSMFRPDNPLLPNYKWIPIGYHGRSSTIRPSGTPVHRPSGQRRPDPEVDPAFGPCKSLDYEVEVGLFFGGTHELGRPITMDEAEEHLFGFCLLNDWSARDMQAWEYQPLGPFLAKSFLSTVSPWIVTTDALAPFRVAPPERPTGDPQPLPYLSGGESKAAFDVKVSAHLSSAAMRAHDQQHLRLSEASFRDMYWSPAQMVVHHASNGCLMRAGDLLGSGTVSGPDASARGCLLELTWRGRDPITLPSGEERRFLEDGDEVVLTGHCEAPGARRIGFGPCVGRVIDPNDTSVGQAAEKAAE